MRNFRFCRCRFVGIVLALILFGALGVTNATADTVAFTPTGGLSEAAPPPAVDLGNVFTANVNFSVDALGFYFQSDLTGPETVGLYNSSGALLTSATVSLTDPVVDGYLFQSITPVALTAGDQYTVVAFIGRNSWSYGYTPPNQASQVTYNSHDYNVTSSLQFPRLWVE